MLYGSLVRFVASYQGRTYLFAAEELYTPAPKLEFGRQHVAQCVVSRRNTYAPEGFARLTLNDVRRMEQSGQFVEEQSEVFPGFPSVHFRDVPWYRKTSVFIPIFLLSKTSEKIRRRTGSALVDVIRLEEASAFDDFVDLLDRRTCRVRNLPRSLESFHD